jgi:ABC-2 type transport system ATP-binding protein
MASAFEAISLTKTYRRWWSKESVQALNGVSLNVAPGSIFGLLGANGAGKTTLVKIALTIARPDNGEVRIFGESLRDRRILRRVGYLPESPRFPAHLTAEQVLYFYGSLSGAPMKLVEENATKWLERLNLAAWRKARVAKFSKGMVERLALAQALVHDPDLIFLDEPTDGLDPMGRLEVRKICRELADAGKTIFVNSHILAEIEMICDRVALMKGGAIIQSGTVSEVTESQSGYELIVPASDLLSKWLSDRSLPFQAVNGHYHLFAPDRSSANGLIDALRENRFEIEGLSMKRRSLESVFIERLSS